MFGTIQPTALTAEQEFFLDRLYRLVSLHQDRVWGYMNETGHRLVERMIYIVYCDCVDVGASEQARQILALLPRVTASA